MFCPSCGTEIQAPQRFCRVCGAPTPLQVQDQSRPLTVAVHKSRHGVIWTLAALCLFGFAIWFFISPYRTAFKLHDAIRRNDAQEMAELIDFPAVRASLKAAISEVARTAIRETGAGKHVAGVGGLIASAMTEPIVDALIAPQTIAAFLSGEQPDIRRGFRDQVGLANPAASQARMRLAAVSRMNYESLDRFVVHADYPKPAGADVVLVFWRSGLFSWRLTQVRFVVTSATDLAGQSARPPQTGMPFLPKLRARESLNAGVQAFKNAKYAEAVEYFKTATEMDPTFVTARLYLATAYMSQYRPGAGSEDNLRMAAAAKESFLKVLDQDPRNEVAIASIASLNFNEAQGIPDLTQKLNKLGEAREWYRRLSVVNPRNKEAFYSLGVIAWTIGYAAIGQARLGIGMRPDEAGPLKDGRLREEIKAGYMGVINEGIQALEAALELDSDYDDAMAYLNLLYRQRADLADTVEASRTEIATADEWLQKAIATRQRKAGTLPPP